MTGLKVLNNKHTFLVTTDFSSLGGGVLLVLEVILDPVLPGLPGLFGLVGLPGLLGLPEPPTEILLLILMLIGEVLPCNLIGPSFPNSDCSFAERRIYKKLL